MADVCVAALYHFTQFVEPTAHREPLLKLCEQLEIRGTFLLAHEGINGTVAGTQQAIDTVLAHIRALPGCRDLDVKFSSAQAMPFNRMKVRVKPEIVSMGVPEVNPAVDAGKYVEPLEWNRLIQDPDTIVIDTRNDYEVTIGTFPGAVDPETRNFRDFPDWFRQFSKAIEGQKKIAMFCTGGIRCEKATAFVKSQGYDDVYHLKGGILRYLETVEKEDNLFQGECFLFDHRVSVGHGLLQGGYELCGPCGSPITAEDKESPHYVHDVSCPHCYNNKTSAQRESYRERRRQLALSLERKQAAAKKDLPLTDK